MIQRTLGKKINKSFKSGFITIIYGPRRVGKTILLKQLTEKLKIKIYFGLMAILKKHKNH